MEYAVQEIKTNKELAEQFATEYYNAFGVVPCVSCTGELHLAINKLSLHLTQSKNKMEKAKSKYKLKADRMLWCEELHMHYTKDNITDEAAKILISEHPEYEKYFDTSDPVKEVGAANENNDLDSEKSVDISQTKTLDKKQIQLKVKRKK